MDKNDGWIKSSYSSAQGNCVEVKFEDDEKDDTSSDE